MPSTEPPRIGPYQLGSELGRGATGVVYEATDERLGRKVALKVLSDDVARTPELRARFAREARLLAAVQHPNVATVYGVEEQDGRVWLALEHVPGETLAELVARGPLPLEDALDAARQIADGLEAAHERGVVHRDLKPANAKRAADGTIKVLDFGLAKPAREGLAEDSGVTSDGLALGTPLYMSPEQLRGKPVDRRADVWALGCVLWELLTGRRPFAGETVADVLHAVLDRDPDPAELPGATPARVRELLARCLQKDPRRRLRDAGDARLELEAALEERAWTRASAAAPGAPAARPRTAVRVLALAALVALAAAAGFLAGARRAAAPPPVERGPRRLVLAVPAGEKRTIPRVLPGGAGLVHELPGALPDQRSLAVRRFDAFEDVPVPGTERVDTYSVSPDGRRLAVVRTVEGAPSRYELVILPLDGSEPPRFVAALPADLSDDGSIAWLDDGRVVLSTRPRALLLVATDGSGVVEEVPVLCDTERFPHAPDVLEALPGTTAVLAAAFRLDETGASYSVVAIDAVTGRQTTVVERSRCASLLASGELLFSRGDVLFRAPFDARAPALAGEPAPVASGLLAAAAWTSGMFHASRDGTVAFLPGGVQGTGRRIVSLRGDAPPAPWSDQVLALEGFLELDETGAYVTAVVVGASGSYELWGGELEAGRLRPLLADPRHDFMGGRASLPRRELVFARNGAEGSQLRRTSLDAPDEGELLYAAAGAGISLLDPSVAAGGRVLAAFEATTDRERLLWFDLAAEPPLEPRVVLEGPRSTHQLRLSGDGRWAVASDRGGPGIVRRVADDGTPGPPFRVPAPGIEAPSTWWGRSAGDGIARLHLMPRGNRSVWEIEVSEGADGAPVFTAPRLLVSVTDLEFYDAGHAGGDRYLAILRDPAERAMERVHVLLGAGR